METTQTFEAAFEEFALSVVDLDEKQTGQLGALLKALDGLKKLSENQPLSTAILSRIDAHLQALILAEIDPVPDPSALYDDIYQQIDILREYLQSPAKQAKIAERWFKEYSGGDETKNVAQEEIFDESTHNTYGDLADTSPEFEEDADVFMDFLHEAREYCETLETEVLELENDPRNKDRINRVFRPFHTLKGVSGFMGLKKLNTITHETESLLDLARNEKLRIDRRVIQAILSSLDCLRIILSKLSPENRTEVIEQSQVDQLLNLLRNVSSDKQNEQFETPAVEPVVEVAPSPGVEDHHAQDNRIRIRTDKLDHLIDMVGELVINSNLVGQDPHLQTIKDPEFLNKFAQMTRVVSELQHASMSLRMVPIGTVFGRMKRIVTDYVYSSQKQIALVIRGDETEIDRSIVDSLYDPLVHMIRNSCDHGVGSPQERLATGKPPRGTITLDAYHQGNDIVIEITDDGKGLNREKILAKAIERGLALANVSYTDEEVFHFIFEPGFSTAEQVTKVSGRGVGMDVVSAFLKQFSGRIDIESKPNEGTMFRIHLPLTLAIIQGMLVRAGHELYIIPVVNTLRTLKPSREQINRIVGQGDTLRLKDRLIPIFRLRDLFDISEAVEDYEEGLLIIVSTGDQRIYGLLVDSLLQIQDVVIKNLGEKFRELQGISGATILGDGRVGLILDVNTILGQ